MRYLIAATLLAAGPAMGQAYVIDLVREGTWDYACTDGETVLSAHQREDTAATACGGRKAADPDGTYYVVAARKRVELAAVAGPDPVEPDPPTEPDPPVEPPVEPPTASCGEPYRGIPDPCAHFGYDVYADYAVDEVITGTHRGAYTISGQGSASDPYVVDASQAVFEVGGQALAVEGQYVILDGCTVKATGEGPFKPRATFSVYRNCDIGGNNTFWSHGSVMGPASDTLFDGFYVHDFGVFGDVENDQHGWKVSSSNVWILNAETTRLSGDGVQCGDASRGSCSNVYIGGGYFHDNRENGVDIKDSRGVVVSGVRMSGFRPTASSSGVALVLHDEAFDGRIYDNVIRDASIGIVSSGMSGHVIEGNDIEASSIGIDLRGTSDLTVRDNRIVSPRCLRIGGGASGDIQQGCE